MPKLVQEANEEFDITFLTTDSQSFTILSSLIIIVFDGFSVSTEHTEEYKKCANHHSCATLSSLTMYYYNGLAAFFIECVCFVTSQFMILLHALKEKTRI